MLHKDIYIYNTDILGQNQEGDYIVGHIFIFAIIAGLAGLLAVDWSKRRFLCSLYFSVTTLF